jgi:acetyltransferase-like isoleucine patch superfamily enzyme
MKYTTVILRLNLVIIGNGVKIQNHVSFYNGVTIEDDVFLNPSMVLNKITNPNALLIGCRNVNGQ